MIETVTNAHVEYRSLVQEKHVRLSDKPKPYMVTMATSQNYSGYTMAFRTRYHPVLLLKPIL